MTIERVKFLVCDSCGARLQFKRKRPEGWRESNGLDYCPACTPDLRQMPLFEAPRIEHPAYKAVVDAFFAAFERTRGCKPIFGSRDGRAAKELAQLGAAEAGAIIDAAFRDPWVVQNNPTLTYIAANANKYRGVPTSSNDPSRQRI